MNNREKNRHVRERLLNTLLEMMEEQHPDTISVIDLTHRSGVGRASFYRNYTTKEDILEQESSRLMREWGRDLQLETPEAFSLWLINLLDFLKEHDSFYLALYRAGQSRILEDAIVSRFPVAEDAPNEVAYQFHSFAYTLFGWVDAWIRRGMQESGAELARMFACAQKNL